MRLKVVQKEPSGPPEASVKGAKGRRTLIAAGIVNFWRRD